MAFTPLALAALVAVVAPQQQVLTGRVVDAASGEPVVAAQVSLSTSGRATRTGDDGAFSLPSADGVLFVSHPDYETARVETGDLPAGMPALTIELSPTPAVDRRLSLAGQAARDAAETAERAGGVLWPREAFEPFLERAGYPLALLIYSGYVARVPDDPTGQCVTVRGAGGCAGIWIDGERVQSAGALAGRAPWEVEAFVIIPPGEASVAFDEYDADGVVAIFFRPGDP